ncbi:hypothetical protein BH09PSE6_BH09PSE6_20700 [soil metagenome]
MARPLGTPALGRPGQKLRPIFVTWFTGYPLMGESVKSVLF